MNVNFESSLQHCQDMGGLEMLNAMACASVDR